MLRKLSAILVALSTAALAPAPAQAAFSAIYAFGDSLSDVGNIYAYTSDPAHGFPQQPAPPYANGQFSNGPVWVQDLAKIAGLSALSPSSLGGTDYAWGDATTGFSGTLNSPNLPPSGDLQVAQFLSDHGNAAPGSGLYTFTLGANDVNNILHSGVSLPVGVGVAQAAALYEAGEIDALAAKGAETFIVALVPDLGLTPGAIAAGPAAQFAASFLANQYNVALESDLSGLAAQGGLHFLDTYSWLDTAVTDPTAVGLPLGTNVTDPCYPGPYTGGVPPAVCQNPGSYIFWDQLHPTAAVHELFAEEAWAFVPSPGPGVGFFSLGLLVFLGLKRKLA